jgi:glutathione synthase
MAIPDLSQSQEDQLVHALQHFALANGLVLYPAGFKPHSPVAAPVTLYPTPLPRTAFERAESVQKRFNELYAKVASDVEWLSLVLDSFAQYDSAFTGKLWESYKKAKAIGIKQNVSLGVFRSDYMLDHDEIKQVEFNTVSVSFGGLSSKVGELHQYLNDAGYYAGGSHRLYDEKDLPVSESVIKLADGLADGVKYYNEQQKKKDTIVLVIVQEGERNVFDQRHLEYSLLKNHGIKSRRITLQQVTDRVYLDGEQHLFLNGSEEEVSVVYYRSGYAPTDFQSEQDWDNRVKLETALSIKAPSLLTQLSGAKKIQQILTDEAILSRFISGDVSQLLSTFVKIYPFDNSELGQKAKKLAFEQPQDFVLKPQREGGGNNIYKEDIPAFLKSLPESEWEGYVLMELIRPPLNKNKIVREGEVYTDDIISELGRFGTILFDQSNGDIIKNEDSGWLLRTKFSSSNEGGVAAGFGCVDSALLI